MEANMNPKEMKFCEEYIFDWNKTRAYKVAYQNDNENSCAVSAIRLLRKPKIQEYIKFIQKDLERLAGISKLKILNELKNTAFSSIAHLHNTWIERKEFETLTEQQKACISEMSYETRTIYEGTEGMKTPVEVEWVKIKLYDKHKSIEILNKMLGYNVPEEINLQLDSERKKIQDLFPKDEDFKEGEV